MKNTWIAFALMVCLSFAACGSGGTDGAGDGDGDNGKPEVAVSPAVGTWVLDTDAAIKAIDEELAKNPNPMGEMMKGMVKGMKVEMVVDADGTFVANMEMMAPTGQHEKEVNKGTWKLEGDQISITTTEKDAVAKETPDIKTATLKDGMITISEKGSPFSLILRKQ